MLYTGMEKIKTRIHGGMGIVFTNLTRRVEGKNLLDNAQWYRKKARFYLIKK